MITITTHCGTFHADEVTAVALLAVFKDSKFKVSRVQHQTTEFDTDYVLDIGRQYDPTTHKFDHHQWHSSDDGRSSAGLIWDHLQDTLVVKRGSFPGIDKFIKAVDANDVGIKPALPMEYSRLLGNYNHSDIHSKKQDKQFKKAVKFAKTMIKSMVQSQQAQDATEKAIKYGQTVLGHPNVLELPEYLQGWGKFVNGETMPKIHAIMYPDKKLDTWNIQTTQVNTESYDKVGKAFPTTSDVPMEFIHKDGFFAVAKTRSDAVDFLYEWNRKG